MNPMVTCPTSQNPNFDTLIKNKRKERSTKYKQIEMIILSNKETQNIKIMIKKTYKHKMLTHLSGTLALKA